MTPLKMKGRKMRKRRKTCEREVCKKCQAGKKKVKQIVVTRKEKVALLFHSPSFFLADG